jgi:hypothetical protein
MALLTNTLETYAAIGLREDLSDVIYMISPTETPFLSAVGRGKAAARRHDWQTDTLMAAADNAQIEGEDAATMTAFTATMAAGLNPLTLRLFNHCQIAFKTFAVSGTEKVVEKAGRGDEVGYQVAKRGQEMKRDMEWNLTGNDRAGPVRAALDDGASNSARNCGGFELWVSLPAVGGYAASNHDGGAGYTAVASAVAGQPNDDVTFVDGTARAFLESQLKNVLQLIYTNGGNPNLVMVGPRNKQNLSAFSGNTTRFDKSEDMRLVTSIDVYVSDYGELRVVPNRFSRERSALVVDTRFWAVAFLRPFQKIDVAPSGDNEKRMVLAEYTLESRNALSSGIVGDLT